MWELIKWDNVHEKFTDGRCFREVWQIFFWHASTNPRDSHVTLVTCSDTSGDWEESKPKRWLEPTSDVSRKHSRVSCSFRVAFNQGNRLRNAKNDGHRDSKLFLLAVAQCGASSPFPDSPFKRISLVYPSLSYLRKSCPNWSLWCW